MTSLKAFSLSFACILFCGVSCGRLQARSVNEQSTGRVQARSVLHEGGLLEKMSPQKPPPHLQDTLQQVFQEKKIEKIKGVIPYGTRSGSLLVKLVLFTGLLIGCVVLIFFILLFKMKAQSWVAVFIRVLSAFIMLICTMLCAYYLEQSYAKKRRQGYVVITDSGLILIPQGSRSQYIYATFPYAEMGDVSLHAYKKPFGKLSLHLHLFDKAGNLTTLSHIQAPHQTIEKIYEMLRANISPPSTK